MGKLAEFGARNIKTVHYLVLITIFTHKEIIILENEKNLVTNEQWKWVIKNLLPWIKL